MSWLDSILDENRRFGQQIQADELPTERQPCPYAVVTCMDPRVNLAAVGIPPFEPTGASHSQVRVIRTLGGIAEERSLVVGIHLAGFKEVAVLMHTDCGCSVAFAKADTIVENLEANLSPEQWQQFRESLGEPVRDRLRTWLHAFEDPRQAVTNEVEAIKAHPFVPDSLVVHGLVYDLSSGTVEVVVNGYGM